MEVGKGLRAAREAAGLSQRDLADGIVTPSFLSLIEAGKRQPSEHVLVALCARLGIAPTALQGDVVQDEAAHAAMAFANAALAAGDAKAAVARLRNVESPLERSRDDRLRLEFRITLSTALEASGDLHGAVAEARESVALAHQLRAHPQWLQASIDLMRCLRLCGDTAAAMDVARDVEASLPEGVEGAPLHLKFVASVIGLYYKRGDFVTAQVLASRALAAAPSRPAGQEGAGLLWNASLAADANGDVRGALVLADQAQAVMQHGTDARLLGQLHVAIAWLHTRPEVLDLAAARRDLEAAQAAFGAAIGKYDYASLKSGSARVHFLSGEYAASMDEAQLALDALAGTRDSLQTLHVLLQLARAQAALGLREASLASLARAQFTAGISEPSRANASAWRELGDAYVQFGMAGEAVAVYQQALAEAGVGAVEHAGEEAAGAWSIAERD